MSYLCAISLICCCAARPLSPISAKPDAKHMMPPSFLGARFSTASMMAEPGSVRTAKSIPSGKSATEETALRPSISLRPRLTRWISPLYSMLSRTAMALRPALPGRSDTPITATDFGLRSRSTCGREIVRKALFAVTIEHVQTGTVFLLIEEARQRAVADVFLVGHAQGH